jgi:hypothetical protein
MRIPIFLTTAALSLTCAVALGAQMHQGGKCKMAQAGTTQSGTTQANEGQACEGACGCGHCGQNQAQSSPGQGHQAHGAQADESRRAGVPGHHELMASIHFLIDHRDQVVREVEPIDGGVLTTTRAPKNPELAAKIQQHVREMYALLENGGRIHQWDPLFKALFDNAEKIELTYEDLEDGIRVRETSTDPEVVELIRAHAEKVNDFVARGREAMHEATPLPSR